MPVVPPLVSFGPSLALLLLFSMGSVLHPIPAHIPQRTLLIKITHVLCEHLGRGVNYIQLAGFGKYSYFMSGEIKD